MNIFADVMVSQKIPVSNGLLKNVDVFPQDR
jgi:hypothetical protein